MDLVSDPDDRYRINEFFYFDSSWKKVLQTLVGKADLVLRDLRAYSLEREGCTYESTLNSSMQICHYYDKYSDKVSAERWLVNSRLPVVWIDCENFYIR